MARKIDKNEQAILRFADAILKIWGSNLQLMKIAMEGHRARLNARSVAVDPYASTVALELALDAAVEDRDTPEATDAKIELVRSIMHFWFRVPFHLNKRIMDTMQELAMLRGESKDAAMLEAIDVMETARNVEHHLQELQAKVEKKLRRKQAAMANARDAQTAQRLQSEALERAR